MVSRSSKVHISEPEEKPRTKLESARCFMCDGVSTKTVLFVCESGHVVCETCRKTDNGPPRLHNCGKKNRNSDSNIKIASGNKMGTAMCYKDFASGDHNHCFKCFNRRAKCKSANNIQEDKKLLFSRKTISEDEIRSKNKSTTLTNKNEKFSDNESSVSFSEINEKKITQNSMSKNNHVQRPVTCPVTDCRKMVARDLILQHFYFDHSKVPRIPMSDTRPHPIFLNASSFSEKTSCYAVFLSTLEQLSTSLLHKADAGALLNGSYKNVSFLLMGVRMSCVSMDTIKHTHGSECVSLHIQLQNNVGETQTSKTDLKADTTVAEMDPYGLEKEFLSKNKDIMLWICKLGDQNYFYTITATRADKKLAYSFTGETMKIEDSHDPRGIWDQVECLALQDKSLDKLTNEQNQLEISVNIFN